jgi:hypothetical protein
LEEVIAQFDEFSPEETTYAADAAADARAAVGSEEVAIDLPYFFEVSLAREAIGVWRNWRPGRSPTLSDKVEAVTSYAQSDAWLPVE